MKMFGLLLALVLTTKSAHSQGEGLPSVSVVFLTTTSATISWTPPEFRLPVIEYTVSLIRITGRERQHCSNFQDQRVVNTHDGTFMSFADLYELSVYSVTVTFTLDNLTTRTTSTMEFSTLTAPIRSPLNVVIVAMTRRATIMWETCFQPNEQITGYIVEFQDKNGNNIPGMVQGRTFIANGLTPGRNYTFRAAETTSSATGPFTEYFIIPTEEETPGPVTALMAQPGFTSILLTWSAPQDPNGIIISYEVTYRVNDGNPVTTNTTDLSTTFTIPSLDPQTRVSDISGSAYTSMGRGEVASLPDVMTLGEPPRILNISLEATSASSVRASWDRIDIPEIMSYRVYYQTGQKEMSISFPSSTNSMVFLDNLKYLVQVVAIADVDGNVMTGQRSTFIAINSAMASTALPLVLGLLLAGIGAVLFVVMLLVLMVFRHKRSKGLDSEQASSQSSHGLSQTSSATSLQQDSKEPSTLDLNQKEIEDVHLSQVSPQPVQVYQQTGPNRSLTRLQQESSTALSKGPKESQARMHTTDSKGSLMRMQQDSSTTLSRGQRESLMRLQQEESPTTWSKGSLQQKSYTTLSKGSKQSQESFLSTSEFNGAKGSRTRLQHEPGQGYPTPEGSLTRLQQRSSTQRFH